jgi:hypothetical protein
MLTFDKTPYASSLLLHTTFKVYSKWGLWVGCRAVQFEWIKKPMTLTWHSEKMTQVRQKVSRRAFQLMPAGAHMPFFFEVLV